MEGVIFRIYGIFTIGLGGLLNGMDPCTDTCTTVHV